MMVLLTERQCKSWMEQATLLTQNTVIWSMHLLIYPDVALSPNFYSWLFKFAGEIILLSPERARNEYIKKAFAVIEEPAQNDIE